MEAQAKKGLLELCVLASLRNSDSYGYKIIQDLECIVEISESTLYPILRRLELNDCLETYNLEYQNRIRKYYKITNAGYAKLREFKKDWSEIKRIYEFILESRL